MKGSFHKVLNVMGVRTARITAGRQYGISIALTLAVLFCCLAVQATRAATNAAASTPVKLVLKPTTRSVVEGGTVAIQVLLHDANNQIAKAPKDLPITVQAGYAKSAVDSQSADIKAGDDSVDVEIKATQSGILRIGATQPELLAGETFVRIISAAQAAHAAGLRRPVVPSPLPAAPPAPPENSAIVPRAIPPLAIVLHPSTQPSTVPATLPDDSPPVLQLFSSPSRKMLADGKDAVTIMAFLQNGPASPLTIELVNTNGSLIPHPLVIPAGATDATATLTSDYVGTAKVSVAGTVPKIADVTAELDPFQFGPAITKIKVEADPSSISLLDRCNVNVTLLDENDKPQVTDEDRMVSVTVQQGNGSLVSGNLAIKAGQFTGTTQFIPDGSGAVQIAATTPGLMTENADLQITWPVLILTLSAIGGCAGGVVAFWVDKARKWWRIVLGVISGLVFYWGFIFLILTHILPSFVLLNPFSAFALSTLGGWLGTKVFDILLKQLGIGGKAAASP